MENHNFAFFKRKQDLLWDLMFWGGLLAALIWAILKSFGYINTPPWAFPVFAFFVGIVGGVFKTGQILGVVLYDLKLIRKDTRRLVLRMDSMAQGLIRMETRMNHSDSEFKNHITKYHS